ncbi:MAG: hypothetical protein ACRD6W_18420 [Nitrososphaerales archaeon]
MPEDNELETHDIYLAAYLKLAACPLKNRRKQGPRVFFIFTNPGGSIRELREAFYSGKAVVKAHDYAQAIVAMKQLCFD